jgi:hypothetical protein
MPKLTKKLTITDKSIEKIGLPRDYKEAIIQYIWNGFEAGATKIKIVFIKDKIDHIDSFSILDDGEGINYDTLEATFGILLDSAKSRAVQSSYIHGGKGKGRLSFQTFAEQATWKTTYNRGGKQLSYSISIKNDSKDDYEIDEKPKVTHVTNTGTEVTFSGLDISAVNLESSDFENFLKLEFGWYLHLKGGDTAIYINAKKLNCKTIIADSDKYTEVITIKDGKSESRYQFTVDYIRWTEKIGEDSFFHFKRKDLVEIFREHTSFNKVGGGAYGFFHSVYVQGKYFDGFDYSVDGDSQKNIFGKNNQSDKVYKELIKKLQEYLTKKRDDFYRESSEVKYKEFEARDTLPKFADNKYDQARKEDFKSVFQEIYQIEPNIFINLKPQQEKSLLGMLDLLIDSDERENVLKIIEGVVTDLDQEGRARLANILTKTSFSSIVRTIKMIEEREKAIELLKTLVFDLQKFATERDHIQKATQDNTWLFGEEFRTVTQDKNFETALTEYLHILDGEPKEKIPYVMDTPDKLRRMDIFMCRQRLVNDPDYGNTSQLEENIVIELKAPKVTIGKTQLRQVEDYRDIIIKQPKIHSQTRIWKFFLVGVEVDEDIKKEYRAVQDKGKRFLVHRTDNFEIYVMTWSDLFNSYKIKHTYLLDKLNFDKTAIQGELNLKGIDLSVSSCNSLTEKLTAK